MLWLKWVLGYCVLVALGLWFLYRSRTVLPGHESAGKAAYDPGRAAQVDDQDPASHARPR